MRLIFDTNVLISATLWDNSVSHKLLIRLIEKDVEIFTSLEILEEYKKAVMRDFKYKEEKVSEIIGRLIGFLKIVKPDTKIDVVWEDPEDNKIIECAIASDSEYILSYDKHLLNLKEFKSTRIITPEEFLKIIFGD